MSTEKVRVVLDIEAEIGKIEGALKTLRGDMSNLQLPKGIGKEFENRISKLSDEIKNFHNLASKMGNSLEGAGKIDASYKKILEYARKVENSLTTIKEEAGIDATKFFPKEIVDRIEKAEQAMKDYEAAIEKGKDAYKQEINDLKAVEKQLDNLRKKQISLEGTKTSKKTTLSETKERQKQVVQQANLTKQASSQEQVAIQKRIALLKEEKEAIKVVQKAQEEANKTKVALKSVKGYDKGNLTQQKSYDSKKRNDDEARANLQRAQEAAKAYGDTLRSIPDIEAEIAAQNQALKQQETIYNQADAAIKKVNAEVDKASTAYNKANQELQDNTNQINQYIQEQERLNNAIKSGEAVAKNGAMSALANALKEINIIIDPTTQSLEEVKNILNNLKPEAIQQLTQALKNADTNVDALELGLTELGNKNKVFQDGAQYARQMNNQMEQLKGHVQQFFSLTNSVMLFRRGIQKAFDAVKELDAAMTETAVVTDFSVGDMWDQLPRYTAAANELGTTTLGAYETMTLFYQQGLETNEVFEIGTETMKMARIAGLDYANATDLMTAALRGFNMELNEASATRINDVYSELAAITAADTGEIANAMTKTASIAANANMEFETTAALLSQIIETTREPAETAGTAMKTIIARFTEMKKATSDIINVDGEEINVNKVEAALKSAGVALRDVNGEFRDLDDVFLELSSKWNGLDKMTQRYVATMAAGSRQQSRFIAMMQDYDRTMELVDAAYNSSGASQKQFEKTQDSLESKINRLKNAWNEFLMGISNSKVIKAGVDALTALLNIINKLTGNSGLLKLGVAIGALAGGNKIFNGLLKSFTPLKGLMNKEGGETAVSFIGGLTQKLNNFKAGKPFVLDADVDTKGITNKINKIKTDFQGLKQAFTEKIPVDTKIGISSISNSMKTLVIEGELAGETIEHSLSEVGIKAILAAQGIEEGSEEAAEFGVEASVAIEAVEKQYEDLIAKAMAYQAIADGTDVDVDIDLPDINNISRKDAGKKAAELFDQANDLNKDEKALKKMKEFGSKSGAAYKNALGQSIKGLGTKIGGTVTAGLSKIAGVFGATGAAAGAAYCAAIVAAVAAVAGSIYAIWYNSGLQVSKRLAEAQAATLEDTRAQADALTTQVKELDEAWQKLTTGQDELDGMVQGTIEWTQKVQELNNEVQSLLEKYPELYKYLNIDKNTGQWTLDEQGYAEYEKKTKDELDETKNRELYEQAMGNYSTAIYEALQKASKTDEVWNWGLTTQVTEDTYLEALQDAYAKANKTAPEKGKKITLDEILSDEKTLEYINNMTSSQDFWGSGAADEKAALKYFQTKKEAQLILKAEEDAYVRNYLASQGIYGEQIQEAVAQTMYELPSMYEQLTQDRSDDGRDRWWSLGGYDGKTGGAGAKMQGESNKSGRSVQQIMEDRGYELVDKTRNIYKNNYTGEYVNVDVSGGGAAGGEKKKRKVNGEEVEVETWSNEYVRDLGRQDELRKGQQQKMNALASVFAKDENLAKVASGDLSADIGAISTEVQKDISYNGEIIFSYVDKIAEFEKSRSDKIDSFNEIYGKLFNSTDTKDIKYTDEEGIEQSYKIDTYSQEAYNAAQGILEFEKTVSGASDATKVALTEMYIALQTDSDVFNGEGAKTYKELNKQLKASGITAEGLNTAIKGLDFSNAIKGAKKLTAHIKKGGEAGAAAKVLITSDEFSISNQIKQMVSAEGWGEIEANFNQLYENYGKITADQVRELSTSQSELSDILDIGTMKASALAAMFEDMAEGELSLIEVTDDLANMYNTLYYSVDLAGDAIAKLKKAEIRTTRTELGDIYTESWDAVKDAIKRGAKGDVIIDDYMTQLVGDTVWQEALDTYGSKVDAVNAIDEKYHLSANEGNLAGSWRGLIADNPNNGLFSMSGSGISWDLTGIKNTADLISQITDKFGVTEEYASAMVGDLTTYSDKFGQLLRQLDKNSAVNDYVNSSLFVGNDGNYYSKLTEKELGTYSIALGEDENYLKNLIDQRVKEKGKEVTYGYKTSERGFFEEQDDGSVKWAQGKNKDDRTTTQEAVNQLNIALTGAGAKKNGQKWTIPIELDPNTEQFSTEMQAFLNTGIGADIAKKVISFEGTAEEFANSGLFTSLVAAAGEAGIDSGNEFITGLFANREALTHYFDGLQDAAYNEVGNTLSAIAEVLKNFSVVIPIAVDLSDTTLGQLWGLVSDTPLSTKPVKIVIGGSGTEVRGSDGSSGFQPKKVDLGDFTTDIDPNDTDIYPDDPNDPDDGGKGEKDAPNYGAENSDAELEALERLREVNEREADLISKLPEQIRPFFEMANLAEKMGYEYQEIQINKNKLGFLKQEEQAAMDELAAKGYLDKYMYYDEQLDEMMWNTAAMEGVSGKERDKIVEAKEDYDSKNDARQAVEKELDGGKVQAFVKALSKGAKDISKVLKSQGKDTKDVDKALRKLEKQLGLTEGSLQPLSDKFKEIVSNSKYLNSEFEGLSDSGDKMVDIFKSGPLGRFMSDQTAEQLKNGGVTKGQMGGSILEDIGGMLGFSGDLLNFDMMGMGMDMFNMGKGIMDQGKQMAEQVIGYITQATQVLVDAWTNREDYLYNFLQIIEKYLHDYEKMQRYSTQLEKGRMATVDDIRSSWEQQWQSLQEQLEMQQERVETRQQQLDMSVYNPFHLISGWNPETDALFENREVKMAWDILIGAIGMLPMGLGAFGQQLNQLYEDYDKRVQEAYEDRLAAEMAILDIEDERLELVKVGSEETVEFQDKVMEAMVQKEQEQIDELTRLNEAITEANSKLISTLQSNLEQIRQDRENEKKEEELSEKQRRLSYLRQDTSGANAVEIKKLEEQLEEEHEDYTDTLIDQKISELEKQNELAAEQRQQQIDLLQAQLDWSEKYGLYWDAIYGMLYTIDENGNVILNPENFDLDGNIRENGELAKMLGTFTDQIGMSLWAQVLEMDELKRLGRYAGAFVGHNGLDGQWADYWALLDPGADDPDYAEPDPVIPDGLAGVLWKFEHGIREYFARSDGGLIDTFGHAGEKIANGLGDLFGIESWSAYDYKTVMRGDVGAPMTDFFVGLDKKTDAFFDELLGRGNKYTQNLNSKGIVNPSESNGVSIRDLYIQVTKDSNVDEIIRGIDNLMRGDISLLDKFRSV